MVWKRSFILIIVTHQWSRKVNVFSRVCLSVHIAEELVPRLDLIVPCTGTATPLMFTLVQVGTQCTGTPRHVLTYSLRSSYGQKGGWLAFDWNAFLLRWSFQNRLVRTVVYIFTAFHKAKGWAVPRLWPPRFPWNRINHLNREGGREGGWPNGLWRPFLVAAVGFVNSAINVETFSILHLKILKIMVHECYI